nr:unnamed protein product [Digitaria exilis]
MRRQPDPLLFRSLATATASPAAPPPPPPPLPASKPPRHAAPFIAVLLRRGTEAAARVLNLRLRAAPASEALSLLSALPTVRDTVSYTTACGVRPNVITYGTLIHGLCVAAEVDAAVELLHEMCESGIEPTVVVYTSLLRRYCKCGRWEDVGKVKDMMVKQGLQPNVVTYSVLIDALCNEGLMKEAMGLLEEMIQGDIAPKPNLITFTSVIHGLCKIGRMFKAAKVLEMMAQRGCMCDMVTYNCLIGGFLRVRKVEMAMKLMDELAGSGLEPDSFTYSILINGFRDLEKAKMVFKQMKASGIVPDAGVFVSLIKGYSAEGQINKVLNLIHEMRVKNVALYSKHIHAIVSSLLENNEGKKLLEGLPSLSEELLHGNITSSQEFMNSLYKACPAHEPCVTG